MTSATRALTPNTVESKTTAWLALLLAGAFEVGYALSVNGSQGFTEPGWSISAFVFFLLTLFFLSVALKGIDVGIGYAVWAGIGAIGAALLGPVFFAESLTPAKAFWLAVIIAGVVWLQARRQPQAHRRRRRARRKARSTALVALSPLQQQHGAGKVSAAAQRLCAPRMHSWDPNIARYTVGETRSTPRQAVRLVLSRGRTRPAGA